MAIGDIFKFDLVGSCLGQEVRNVFYYRVEDADWSASAPEDLAEDFWSVISTPLLALVSAEMVFNQIDVARVGGVEIGTFLLGPDNGSVTGQCLPPHDAFAFRYNRASAATRHGYKRFAGVPESAQDNGVLATDFNDEVSALAVALGSQIAGSEETPTASYNLEPIILSRFFGGAERVTPVAGEVSSVQYVRISTQNTRKVYR